MRLFPQGVYFRSHMVWLRNNKMQSQNDTSDFRNNMQENGKEHYRKYPVFPTWQSVISEICNFVSKQHVKFWYHICSLETVIGPKSTWTTCHILDSTYINFETTCVYFDSTHQKLKNRFEFTVMIFETTWIIFESTWIIFESTWSEKFFVKLTQIRKNHSYMRRNQYEKNKFLSRSHRLGLFREKVCEINNWACRIDSTEFPH
jgi:hypothetical protein